MKKTFITILLIFLSNLALFAQDKSAGVVKGTVKSTDGKEIAGVAVEARQDDKVVGAAQTDKNGDFKIANLKPGTYRFIFNKNGLSQGVSKEIEIKPKAVVTLKNLILAIDEGTLAIVRGSVFDSDGRIALGVKIELRRINGDGARKIGEKFTGETGEFTFRLPPDRARYRLIATADKAKPTSKDLDIDGAETYRLAITLNSIKE